MAVLPFPRSAPKNLELHTSARRPIRLFKPASVGSPRRPQGELIWGMPSRQALLERLRTVGELAPAAPLSFLAVEISGLYAIGDSADRHTHETVVHAVAHGIHSVTRSTDVVGRLNASSFGVVLQGVGATAAGAVADRLTAHLNVVVAAWRGAEVRVSGASGTGVNAMALVSAALDSTSHCC